MSRTESPAPRSLPPAPEQLVHRLEWRVIRRLDGLMQGDYRTLFHGPGLDFADLREYEAGDDPRHIDWNVTARLDTPYVREYTEDRELTAWMLLDRSPSMSFGPEERPKGFVLAEIVAILARLLTRRGNRVGAMFYGSDVESTIPAAGGRTQVLRLTHELLKPPPRVRAETDLAGLMFAALNTIKRRSLVFIISDFISVPGWEKPLSALTQRHDVVAIRLWDRREMEIPDAGVVVIEDSETGEQLLVDTSDRAFRERVASLAHEREEALKAEFLRANVEPFDVGTGDDLVMAIVRMAERRKRRFQR